MRVEHQATREVLGRDSLLSEPDFQPEDALVFPTFTGGASERGVFVGAVMRVAPIAGRLVYVSMRVFDNIGFSEDRGRAVFDTLEIGC